MRSRTNNTVSVRAVHAHAATLIETHLKIRDHGHKCRAAVLPTAKPLFGIAKRVLAKGLLVKKRYDQEL